jgi:hypothetical protein
MYPDDWQFRLTTGVVSVACIAAAMMLGPVVGINWHERFGTLMLLLVVAMVVGNLLGGLVYRLLFHPPSGGPPEKEKK